MSLVLSYSESDSTRFLQTTENNSIMARKKQDKNDRILTTPTEVILESISDGVFTVDLDWRVTSFNRAAETITGVLREEAIGRRCSEVFRSSMCGDACALHETIQTGKPVVGKSAYIVDAAGNRIPISVSTAVLRDEKGNVIGGVETFRDLSEVEALRNELQGKYYLGEMASRSPLMQRLFEMLPAIAASPSTVLICGETGTGKELVARTIHELSPRRSGPFVAVNCAALPDTLLESELFGHKAGAFTGAIKDKPGRFALARGGTLFLDEIGDISPSVQSKLLRVLQERTYEPLGATRSETADVRILAATNKDLAQKVRQQEFREDLYYRINVVRMELPPLRKRKEDIPLLVDQFIKRFNRLHQKSIQGIAPEALSLLMAYDWPGNIRQLENVVEHAFILCTSQEIRLEHFPPELLSSRRSTGAGNYVRVAREVLDSQLIRSALEKNNYNISSAANELGIHRSTLYRRIKQLGLELPNKTARDRGLYVAKTQHT